MRSIRLHEWVLTILNQTIRADAEFQINQRNAWQEFARITEDFNGIDLSAGFQHQRNLDMNELTFELDLTPDVPGFWDRVVNIILFRQREDVGFYRLRKPGEQDTGDIHVKLTICRDSESRFQPEVIIEPKDSRKPEDIQIVGIKR